MSPLYVALIGVGGAGGALGRYVMGARLGKKFHGQIPWATVIINVSGAFIMGLLVALFAAVAPGSPWLSVLTVGVLGGYTTFSTASVDVEKLFREGKPTEALITALTTLVLTVVAATLGFWVGGLF